MTKNEYQLIVSWDVQTWVRAIRFWQHFVEKTHPELNLGLELGAEHGGLSYFFAKQYGSRMYCSDYGFPSEKAKQLHQREGVASLISYHEADAAQIPFEAGTFDFVTFKSVLGAVGAHGRFGRIEQAIKEIHRVLKPGGVLFFAENLRGSWLHRQSRAWFVPWGKAWYYLSWTELNALFRHFPDREIRATGFGAAFVPKPEWLKNLAAGADEKLSFLPDEWKYVGYGAVRKEYDLRLMNDDF